MQGRYLSKSPPSDQNRDRLKTVVDVVRPSQFLHGHYHVYYKHNVMQHYGPVRVVGLGCDGMDVDSISVFDTELVAPVYLTEP